MEMKELYNNINPCQLLNYELETLQFVFYEHCLLSALICVHIASLTIKYLQVCSG